METQTQFRFIESIELVNSNSRHDFPIHSHRVFCMGIVTEGQLIFQLVGGQFILNPLDIYFVPAGIAHTVQCFQGLPYQHIVICVQEKRLAQIPAADILRDEKTGKTLLSLIHESAATGSEEKLLPYINELCSSFPKVTEKEQLPALLQGVLAYIQKHLDEPFSLDDLCAAISVSKYHLIRLVKAQCGLTPHQLYVQEKIRAVRSGILLDESLTELAHRYHFTDQSHFCHVFKAATGITPREYMRSVEKF